MKKIIYGLFLISTSVFSQNSGDFELGATGGINISEIQLATNNNSGTIIKFGFNAGVSLEYYFSDSWGIKAKGVFFQKGFSDGYFLNYNTGVRTNTDYRLNYLTVPVMGTFHFWNWYANLGPYIGFLLNAEATEIGYEVTEAFPNTDVGVAFAVGHRFSVAQHFKLTAEIGGQQGFIDTFEGDGIWSASNSYFVNVGVLFSL